MANPQGTCCVSHIFIVVFFEWLECRASRVYVHCTAGLGRAPAVCIAYLYWWCGMELDQAYQHLTDIRPCGPKAGVPS